MFPRTQFGEWGAYPVCNSRLLNNAVSPTPMGFLDLYNMIPGIDPTTSPPPDTLNLATSFFFAYVQSAHQQAFCVYEVPVFSLFRQSSQSLPSLSPSPVLSFGGPR